MRRIFFNQVILILIISSGCIDYHSNTDNGIFTHEVLERLSKGCSAYPPSPECSFQAFCLCNDDSVAVFFFSELNIIFPVIENKNYPSLLSLFKEVTLKNYKLDCKSTLYKTLKPRKFIIDTEIKNIYKEKGLSGLKKKYTTEGHNGYILNSELCTISELNSITYFFYTNGYIRIDNDYIGQIQFRSL